GLGGDAGGVRQGDRGGEGFFVERSGHAREDHEGAREELERVQRALQQSDRRGQERQQEVIHPYGALLVLGVAVGTAVTVGRATKSLRFDALAAALLAFGFGLVGAAALYRVVSGEVGGLVWYGGFLGGLGAVA